MLVLPDRIVLAYLLSFECWFCGQPGMFWYEHPCKEPGEMLGLQAIMASNGWEDGEDGG